MELNSKGKASQISGRVKRSHEEMADDARVSRDGTDGFVKPHKRADDNLVQNAPCSSSHASALEPYTTLGRLSYAPATQTTVVTTTTTTTTAFPPLIMKPPRSLYNRDPKQYPLALTPTPQSLRSIELDINGRPALFEEEPSEDSLQVLSEIAQHQAQLDAANGTLQSVSRSGLCFEVPNGKQIQPPQDAQPISKMQLGKHIRAEKPPSLAEAAEIASQHRRSNTRRGSHYDTFSSAFPPSQPQQVTSDSGPATPETEVDNSHVFIAPALGARLKRVGLRNHAKTASAPSLEQEPRLPNTLTRSSLSRHAGPSRTRPNNTVAGAAATPPIVEGDLEEAEQFDEDISEAAHRRLPPIDTLAGQDATLPSPSLSPITAAANLASQETPTHGQEEDENDVSSLDLSDEAHDVRSARNLHQRRASVGLHMLEMPPALPAGTPNGQLPTPTFMDLPAMLQSFDSLPPEMQRWMMYQMLRRCDKDTLQFVAGVVNPALKRDFLAQLPIELSLQITRYLDVKSMCRAAQVSKKWRQILDSDEKAWKNLLDQDGFELPDGELERAIHEGWGWQSPYGLDSGEQDLSQIDNSDRMSATTSPRSVIAFHADAEAMPTTSSRPKRKAGSRHGPSSKRQKRKGAPQSGRQQYVLPLNAVDDAQGPIAHASAAAVAVPNAEVGLASLRNLHLYKSLYRRHYLIGKSWMQADMKPRHIAFRAHQRHVVTCLQFDADKILTGSDDTKINVYDTKTGAKRRTLEGHEGGVWALEYDGNTLVSGSTDRSVRVWDIETGKCLQVFQGHTSTVRCLVILKPAQIDTHDDGTPIMAPKQPLIITGSRDSSLRVWRLPKPGDKSIHQAGPPANDYENPYFVRALTGHHHSVRAIAAHGDTLVSGSYDCTVRVWRISTGEMQRRLSGHTQKVYSVVLDHKRKRCISGSMDNLVKVWSLEQGICLFNLEGHTSLVGLLDLSHERLVSAAADCTLRIWDPDNGQCKAKLTAHTGAITCFQHDHQKVISGSDKLLKMWDIRTGDCTKDLLTNLSGVWQVKFNDRRCVAAVQRNSLTYIEVLDFGASRDGVSRDRRGVRIVVDKRGNEIPPEELEDTDDSLTT